MIGTVFRSDDVPAEDRFDAWRELVGRTRPSDASSVHAAAYSAKCHFMELGQVGVLRMSSLPTNYRRSPRTVRQSDPERYHLTLLLDGELALEHAGRIDTLGSGELHVVDSSRPYDLHQAADRAGRPVKGIGMDFPKRSLPMAPHRIQALLSRRLPGQEGPGRY